MIERAVTFSIKTINADSQDDRINELQAELDALERAEAQAYSGYALAYAA